MRESDIESYFTERARQTNSWQRKFTSPSCRGVPDRVACISGYTVFIEFKAPGKKLMPMQVREHAKMGEAGCVVMVIDSIRQVDELFEIR